VRTRMSRHVRTGVNTPTNWGRLVRRVLQSALEQRQMQRAREGRNVRDHFLSN
jgi:hypothetical protein